jgi:hypothetical protein
VTLIVGIDPGVTTGCAKWDTTARALLAVESRTILHAMRWIIEDCAIQADAMGGMLVVFEDCRNHRVYIPGAQRNDAALQGVGSVKRDCGIWEEFLTDARIPYITRMPRSSKTKLKADEFKARTGWDKPSNNHGRDAGMLVAGTTDTQARLWLAESMQRQTRKA